MLEGGRESWFFRPSGAGSWGACTHSLRCGLYSGAAARLIKNKQKTEKYHPNHRGHGGTRRKTRKRRGTQEGLVARVIGL